MDETELLSGLYPMPWAIDNNPNAWIEVTTHCQLKCAGCYRGLDQPEAKPMHESLDVIKDQVDKLIEMRSPECVSIAGGDPLLYPDLVPLLQYIKQKNCYSLVFTNGIALTDKLCQELNECGAGTITFLIHVAEYQGRKETVSLRKEMFVDGEWNLCSSCPDAMLHEDKLVPSCFLERIKRGEIITA